jgi:hypothetical protein
MTAVIARNRRLTGNRVNAIAARVWHLMNLPALDRVVRRLSVQLDRDSRKPD